MDTIRVDICYRPLRIAWAIGASDLDSFRTAVQYSHALWGGRFNPIVVVDNEEEAGQLIDLFRVDFILPIGDTEAVKKFSDRFRHLIKPFFNDRIFIFERNGEARAQALDIHNALVHFRDKPQAKALRDEGIRVYKWSTDDPLANVFVVMFGQYPSPSEINIDYGQMIVQGANATEHAIDPAVAIPEDTLKYPTIAYLSRYTVKRHYSVQAVENSPGFFIGDASNFDDLVCHWNLRAADIPLWFIDPNHIKRYANIIPAWYKGMQELVSTRHEWDRHVGVWSRSEDVEKTKEMFGDKEVATHTVSIHTWNGLNLKSPMMYYDEVSTMGVIGKDGDKPKVAFALNNKPFCGDVWFHTQHLVASISFLGGLYGDEQFTLSPPLIPELNEFYARTMHFMYNVLRIEPGRIGIVIDAADTDSFLNAMPVSVLIEKVLDMAKLSARPSPGGLITRQLIAQLGGLRNADVFKIPGVRRLLKTYGPTATFTKDSALQLIGGRDPQNPESNFKDYQDLYIEPRPPSEFLMMCS